MSSPINLPSMPVMSVDQGVQIERHGVQHLLTAEGEQLCGETRGTLGCLDDLARSFRCLVGMATSRS
jgi:hypothetical protein